SSDEVHRPRDTVPVDVLEPRQPAVQDVALRLNEIVVAVAVDVDDARTGLNSEGTVLTEVEHLVRDEASALAVNVFQPTIDTGDVDVAVAVDVAGGHAPVNRWILFSGERVLDERSVEIGLSLVPPHTVVGERDDLGLSIAVQIGSYVVMPRDDA